jgi:hypothetical protein
VFQEIGVALALVPKQLHYNPIVNIFCQYIKPGGPNCL